MELTRPDGSPLRVLVVDDEVNLAELVAMALRYEGFETRMAHAGATAEGKPRWARSLEVMHLLPAVLRRLHAPLGVWAVTGNHEFYGEVVEVGVDASTRYQPTVAHLEAALAEASLDRAEAVFDAFGQMRYYVATATSGARRPAPCLARCASCCVEPPCHGNPC